MHQNLDTWVFLLLASIRKAPTVAEIEPMSLDLSIQCLSN